MNNSWSRRWQKLLANVRNKRFWYTVAGLVATVLIVYVVELTFVSVNTKQRAVIGVCLQLSTGFILLVDQVVANLKLKSNEDVWNLVAKRGMKISLIVCLLLSLIAFLYWVGINYRENMSPIYVYVAIFAVVLLYYPYLLGIQLLVRLLEKGRNLADPLVKESSIIWGNLILLGISAPVVLLTVFFVKPQLVGQLVTILVSGIVAMVFTPILAFSLIFFFPAGIIGLFVWARQKVKRSVFWLVLLVFWSWGGLLLLADVLAR